MCVVLGLLGHWCVSVSAGAGVSTFRYSRGQLILRADITLGKSSVCMGADQPAWCGCEGGTSVPFLVWSFLSRRTSSGTGAAPCRDSMGGGGRGGAHSVQCVVSYRCGCGVLSMQGADHRTSCICMCVVYVLPVQLLPQKGFQARQSSWVITIKPRRGRVLLLHSSQKCSSA
jgi:hypothetical protein